MDNKKKPKRRMGGASILEGTPSRGRGASGGDRLRWFSSRQGFLVQSGHVKCTEENLNDIAVFASPGLGTWYLTSFCRVSTCFLLMGDERPPPRALQ